MAKKIQVIHDAWDSYVMDSDDGPIFISFDVEAAQQDLTDSLQNCARVLVPIKDPNQNGGPVGEESERLWAMEESLCELLTQEGVRCRLVGRITHQGMREIVFQLDDWEEFRPPVGYWMGELTDYEVDVSEHEGWEFFDNCIRPSEDDWLFMADRSVVDNLREAGSNMEKEHDLEFVFNGKTEGLRRVVQALTAKGYSPLPQPGIETGQVVMVKRMIPDVWEISAETQAHRKMAQDLGVTYDGWGCEVVT